MGIDSFDVGERFSRKGSQAMGDRKFDFLHHIKLRMLCQKVKIVLYHAVGGVFHGKNGIVRPSFFQCRKHLLKMCAGYHIFLLEKSSSRQIGVGSLRALIHQAFPGKRKAIQLLKTGGKASSPFQKHTDLLSSGHTHHFLKKLGNGFLQLGILHVASCHLKLFFFPLTVQNSLSGIQLESCHILHKTHSFFEKMNNLPIQYIQFLSNLQKIHTPFLLFIP